MEIGGITVRNGSVWIEHSLSFRGRACLFFTETRWQEESKRYYARMSLLANAATFSKPLLAKVRTGVDAVAVAARSGVLRIDDEIHLSVFSAEDEDPEVILAVDAQVRFSCIMLGREPRSTWGANRGQPGARTEVNLGREPRSTEELLMFYAGIMAYGTSLTSPECARMIPQLSASVISGNARAVRNLGQYQYNEKRIKISLGSLSPIEYRASLGITVYPVQVIVRTPVTAAYACLAPRIG